jgi:dephospho-CoA kinase
MPKYIIGLVGQAGCGKGTVSDLLQSEYGAAYFRFSAILGDLLTRLHLEHGRDNFIKMSNTLRETFGEDVLSYAIEKDAVESSHEIVVLDGIRRPEDIVALEPLPFFKLVAIRVPAEIRYERMKGRGEKAGEQNLTWEAFLTQEQSPADRTVPFVMERAWKTIPNSGTREELEQNIRAMMSELGFHSNTGDT